MYKSMETVH